ncbi:hypothetical protein Tco_0324132 [Tanacetum coccineum]
MVSFNRQKLLPNTLAKYSRQALFFTIKSDSILSSQAHTLLSLQPPPHSPPPRSIATGWSDMIKLLSARVKEEMWCCEHHANLTVMPVPQDRGCGYFMWINDLRLYISSSSGSSAPLSSYPGTSTRPSYSPRTSRSAQNLGKAECSNCKFLAEKIKTLEAKIKILEGALEMKRHPEKHALESAAILHELYNDMGKLEGSDKDYELNLSMYEKAAKLEKLKDAKLAWLLDKYYYRSQESVGCSSSHANLYLTEKELYQLHLDEEALRETLEEQAMDAKAREEKIRQKQADDDEFFLTFGRVRIDSDYESSD